MGQGRHTLRSISDPVYPRVDHDTQEKIYNREEKNPFILSNCLTNSAYSILTTLNKLE